VDLEEAGFPASFGRKRAKVATIQSHYVAFYHSLIGMGHVDGKAESRLEESQGKGNH
jgi:hypothetical protein